MAREEAADGAESEEDEEDGDEEDDDEDDDDDEPDNDDGDRDDGAKREDEEEETEQEDEGGFPDGGGRGGGLPWGVSTEDSSDEPRVPKCRTTPGSSRIFFPPVFRARNSRMCFARSPLARSFLLRVAAMLRVPLCVFPSLGLEGSDGSEFP